MVVVVILVGVGRVVEGVFEAESMLYVVGVVGGGLTTTLTAVLTEWFV